MRGLSPVVAVLVAAALAALLVAYVFADRAPPPPANADARCTSPAVQDQIKRELFRRASALRGSDQTAIARVASYSVLRVNPPIVRKKHGSDAIACAGSFSLDLPPGVEVVGDRRSLTTRIAYMLDFSHGGSGRMTRLSNVEALVALLSTVMEGDGRTAPPLTVPQAAPGTAAPAPPPAAAAAPATPAPSRATRDTRTPPPARPALPAPVAREPEQAQATRRATRSTPVRTQSAGARPSFNCRYARTRGEVAACSDGGLAGLDRQMAAQFYRAMSVATPAQRALLQRTRSRFLAFRDSCGSRACMAGAYQDRMREISDIMAGRWRPN